MNRFATLALLLTAIPASAFPCRQQVVVHEQAVVVTPTVQQITVVVPTYGLIPYGATYAAPAVAAPVAAAPATTQDDVLRALVAEIKGLRADLGSAPRPQAAQAEIGSAVKILSNRCAKCHGADSARTEGGSFVLFGATGEFIPVRPGDAKRIVNYVSRGMMPPPPSQIPESEKAVIIQAFGGEAPKQELPKAPEPKKTQLSTSSPCD